MKPTLIITSVLMLLTHHNFTKSGNSSALIFLDKSSKVYTDVSLVKTVYHKFSSASKPDKFEITLKGTTILNGKVAFTIHNSLGKLIYEDSFDANLLIDYGLNEDNPSVKKQETYIKKRFSAFFNQKKFDQPAIRKTDKFDNDYSENKKAWDEIKGDPAAVGFTYLTGEENSRSISWSPKQQKVIIYFTCC